MNVRSMTGFGRAHGHAGDRWRVDVVARSVNHRFLDLSIRLREEYAELEPVVRKLVNERMSRGKIEVSVHLRRIHEAPHEIVINETLLEQVLSRFAALAQKYPVAGRIEVRDLLTIPEVVRVDTATETFDPADIAAIRAIVGEAVDALVKMRETEGRLLAADVRERIEFLKVHLSRVDGAREEVLRRLHTNLRERIALLFTDTSFDPARLEQEAALLADRSDVAEEITRLDSHLAQMDALLAKGEGAVGKKLDFLAQEIHREVNTLGSKSRDPAITRDVLEMKAEAEKIREQVQNIE